MVFSRLFMSRHPKTASKAHPRDVPTLHTLRSHVDEVSGGCAIVLAATPGVQSHPIIFLCSSVELDSDGGV